MSNKNYEIFSQNITDPKFDPSKPQQNVMCPFGNHDTEASLSINLEKGFYKCFGCQRSGDIYKWYMEWNKCSFREAKFKIIGDSKISILSQAEVDEAHNTLLNAKYLQTMLLAQRGWKLDTILKFKLGWNDFEKRIQIPIYDEHGNLKNIRKYLTFDKPTAQNPKFRGVRGHNDNYFFPIQNLITQDEILSKFIVLTAGEPDTILACQLGINAGTFTTGEGNFNRDLLPYFSNKIVYICYDKDLAGLQALKSIVPEMYKYAKEIKIINLPFGG